MNCIHGHDMAISCSQCAMDLASQAQPYQPDKVEEIEFAEIPRAWPEAEGKPAIDAENSMAVATRELAESIAHLAPAVSALAAAYAGSRPSEVRDAPIFGPVTDAETNRFTRMMLEHNGSTLDSMHAALTAFARVRGLL